MTAKAAGSASIDRAEPIAGECGCRPIDARAAGPVDRRVRRIKTDPGQDRQEDFHATLLAMATHELRQPLQVIVSAQEMLVQRLAAAHANLQQAERASTQLMARLDFLAEALRIDLRQGGPLLQPVAVEPLLRGLAQELGEPARQKGLDLRVLRSQRVILSHPILFQTLLRNLLDNAIAYTPRGGRVLVGCRRRGAAFRIEVRDTGRGMPPDDLMKVFDAFQRRDQTRAEGLGLGLFIVQRAAAALGHRIEVRSAVGRGSCFAVTADAAA